MNNVEFQLVYDSARTKASILATVGPKGQPGVVLSGHTDVVPAEANTWRSDPFEMDVRDGRAYGRGSTDMKGFLAAVLAHVPRWRGAPLVHPVHLAFSYDEEVGCRGAPDLVAAVARLEPRPSFCIVGEPTGMRLVTAHKGKAAYRVAFRGRAGHSAMPHLAANAVESSCRIVSEICRLGHSYRDKGPHDARFEPAWSTVHVASIRGGDALNIVPDFCEFQFEIRNLPGHRIDDDVNRIRASAERLLGVMRRQAPESGLEWEELARYPALLPANDASAARFVAQLSGSGSMGGTVSFGTEAGIYAEAGIPTVVCGPGDIARAHKADEYIELTELADCEAFLGRLTDALCKPLPPWMRTS